VPVGSGLLVDTDVADAAAALALEAALNGPLHHVPNLVPAHPQDTRGAKHVRLVKHVDDEPLEHRREAAAGLGPRQTRRLHAMRGAFHSRRPGVEVRLELAAIEVAPGPLGRVVVASQLGAALRAWPPRALGVRGPHVDLLPVHVELHTLDRPRRLDPQQMPVKLGVSHLRRLRAPSSSANSRDAGAWRGGRGEPLRRSRAASAVTGASIRPRKSQMDHF
jgi:hypothetical protein